MGCSASKPWKKPSSEDNVIVGAYQWDERECGCGTNEFKLVEEPDSMVGFQNVKDIIEPKLYEAVDIIMENATRSCCCASLDFDPVIEVLNEEWCPKINARLEEQGAGFIVDAFTWKEWQYNGQSSREASFFILRIQKKA